jgi:hypothetical protein
MITHVLKDGTIKKDITGHVVKMKDCKALYQLLDNINRGIHNEVKKHEKTV